MRSGRAAGQIAWDIVKVRTWTLNGPGVPRLALLSASPAKWADLGVDLRALAAAWGNTSGRGGSGELGGGVRSGSGREIRVDHTTVEAVEESSS